MHHEHTEWCLRALEAGKHVLCEKPLCATGAEARRIAAAAERAGRLCAEGFMYMHHPQSRRLVELGGVPEAGGMRDSPIGRLKAVHAWRLVRNNDQYILNTRLSHAMQGGSVMDLGCYPISAALLVTGAPAKHVRASARWSKQRPGERGVVDEACTFSFTMATSVGEVSFEGGCSFSDEPRVYVELIGDRGRAWTDYPFSPHESRQVLLVNEKEEVFENAGDRFVLQFGRFARAVRGDEPMIPSMDFSIRQADAIEAIHRAIGLTY
jgi:predicted dehydrogenase